MSPSLHPGSTQPQILRTYTALHRLHSDRNGDWDGSLILACGLSSQGAALALASNIAGAVCLNIEDNPTHMKEAIRTGSCDFIVNTLDEAIRAMKNELRKHTPLSIALNGNPAQTLADIEARGLAPHLFASFLPPTPYIAEVAARLHALGATLIDFQTASPPHGFQSSQSILAPLIEAQSWTLETFPFETFAAIRDFDARALALLPPADTLRRRWLAAAPRILPRERPLRRALWLTEHERQTLSI